MGQLRVSGTGDLTKPRVNIPGQSHAPKAIPNEDEPVIKAMERAADDGTTAGAEGLSGEHPPGSQPSTIPYRSAIVAPPGFHVP